MEETIEPKAFSITLPIIPYALNYLYKKRVHRESLKSKEIRDTKLAKPQKIFPLWHIIPFLEVYLFAT